MAHDDDHHHRHPGSRVDFCVCFVPAASDAQSKTAPLGEAASLHSAPDAVLGM